MYEQKKDGGFRLRASFPVTSDLIMKANRVCELEHLSMYALCRKALEEYVANALHVERMPLEPGELVPEEALMGPSQEDEIH